MVPGEAIAATTARTRPWVWGLAALGYFLATSVATWPVVTRFGSEIPGELTDPLEHLWIMRWLRSCLLDGRNPLFCPLIQAPVGVPLGAFPTLHLQTALYLLLRLLTSNDAAIFTSIWFLGFVATGLASFGLARWAIPGLSGGVAWTAGLGMMLCGPMLMHAHGHLETMQMGVVPPFLIAWMRFNDRPGRLRLVLAAGCYLLVVAAAPYFAVLAIFPAVWYSAWLMVAGPERWTRARRLAPWLLGFGVVVLPGVALLFGAQIQAAWSGWPMTRSKRLFDHLGAPPWSSLVPSPYHYLGQTGASDLFDATGYRDRLPEVSSYLGLVALGLLAFAALKRVDFPRRSFWWSSLALLVVLSWGSRQDLFGASVPLPAGWIYDIFPPFHLIRVPARFNLFAAAVAVVPVAAGLDRLVRGGRSPLGRAWVVPVAAGLTLGDLAMIPFPTATIPDPPAFYAAIQRDDPGAVILEAPLFDSARGQIFSSLWGYWQQRTGLATSGGYPGLTNARFDAEVARSSIFSAARVDAGTRAGDCGRDGLRDVRDRTWIELTVRGYAWLILHHDPTSELHYRAGTDYFADQLKAAVVYSTPTASAVARDRLNPPSHLTWLSDEGWRPMPHSRDILEDRSAALAAARIMVYQPSQGAVVLSLAGAEAFATPRVVRVVEADRELARFTLEPGAPRTVATPPIPLSPGLHTWTLRSDGASRPTHSTERFDDAGTPYSFRLSGVRLTPSDP